MLFVFIVACQSGDSENDTAEHIQQVDTSTRVVKQHEEVKASKATDTFNYKEHWRLYQLLSYDNLEESFLKEALAPYFIFDNDSDSEYLCTCEQCDTRSYTVKLSAKPFDSTAHTITRTGAGWVSYIDDRIYFGCDGGLPREAIERFTVLYKGATIDIPEWEYNDLYEPSGVDKFHLTDGVNNYVVILMNASDGAGSYTVAWIFKDGKYVRRVVGQMC